MMAGISVNPTLWYTGVFQPENILIHVSQNFFNFFSSSMFWFILMALTQVIYLYIYKVVISVCFFVCMSYHNSGTPWSICLKFWLGNSGEPWECSLLSFKIISLVGQLLQGKIANISMYDQARVNSRSNYKFHGQRRVPTLVGDKIVTGLPTKIESIKDDCTECIRSVSL